MYILFITRSEWSSFSRPLHTNVSFRYATIWSFGTDGLVNMVTSKLNNDIVRIRSHWCRGFPWVSWSRVGRASFQCFVPSPSWRLECDRCSRVGEADLGSEHTCLPRSRR